MSQAVADSIVTDIAAVGEQTREVARRYERVFLDVRGALADAAARAPSLAEAALSAMTIAEAAGNALLTHLPNQPPRDCRAGCDACCHLYVMVPPGVAEAIGAHLSAHRDADQIAALREELAEVAAAAAALPDPSSLRRRCVLLGADGLCTVYPVRPPTCRAFTSTSVAACRSLAFDPNSPVASIPQNPSQFRVFVEATAALEQAAAARGVSPDQRGLAEALLAVLFEGEAHSN